MSTLIKNGYPIFTDKNGDPLENGYIFIGEAGLNPVSNPQTSYWDASLTIPAANIRTSQGYPVYNGSPGRLYVEDNYSILVQDKNLNTVYVQLNALDFVTVSSLVPGFDRSQVVVKSSATVTVKAGSTVDVNGTSVEILSDTDLQITLVDTDYFIRLTDTGVLSIQTGSGTYDINQNARYDGGDRILNWKVRRNSTTAYAFKLVDIFNLTVVGQDTLEINDVEFNAVTAEAVAATSVNTSTINTGHGDVECYAMNQPTRTTDNLVFNEVRTTYLGVNNAFLRGWKFSASTTQGTVYSTLGFLVPSIDDRCSLLGVLIVDSTPDVYRDIAYIKRTLANRLVMYDTSDGVISLIDSGSPTLITGPMTIFAPLPSF